MTYIIDIVGCGGNGSKLANKLVPTISSLTEEFYIRFIDADVVKAKNIERQDYTFKDCGKPKAKILAERYGHYYSLSSYVDFYNTYVLDKNIANLYEDTRYQYIVFLCLDNMQSRKDYYLFFKNVKNLNWLIFDLGNHEDYGQIITYSSFDFNNTILGTTPDIVYPNFLKTEYNDAPCSSLVSKPGKETIRQTLIANEFTSLLAYDNFIKFVKQKYYYGLIEWVHNINTEDKSNKITKIEHSNKITIS